MRRRLSNIIRHFKFEELETAVLPLFPEITWHRTKTKLVKHRESFSVSNVSKLIENALDVSDTIIIYHSNKRQLAFALQSILSLFSNFHPQECRVDEKFLKERISILEVIGNYSSFLFLSLL